MVLRSVRKIADAVINVSIKLKEKEKASFSSIKNNNVTVGEH